MKSYHNNTRLKTFFYVILCSVVLSLSCIINSIDDDGVNNTNYEAKEPFYFEINDIGFNSLQVAAINGNVEIIAVLPLDTIIVEGERIVKSESIEDAEAHLPDLQVVIDQSTEVLIIKTEQPSHTHGRSYQINYKLHIPASWEQLVTQTNGNISSTGGQEHMKMVNNNGNIVIRNCETNIEAILTNGNISITDVIGSVNAYITNGNIISKMILPENGECRHETINGIIQLSIPTNTSATFSATTVNGSVSISNLDLNNPQITQKSVSGILGDGKGQIVLRNTNGNVSAIGY